MATYLYRGFTDEGRRVCGSGAYASEEQLKKQLRERGIENADIFPSKTVWKRGMYKLVSPKELSVFCKQMSVLFISQITLMEGLVVLSEQADNKHLKQSLDEIYAFMERGFAFSESVGMYAHIFSEYLISMVVIGETSGTLDEIFSRMSDYYDKESKIRKKIRSAITYPAALTALMTAVVVLLVVRILPMFNDILASIGAEMPAATGVILQVGSFLASYALYIFGVLILIIIALVLYFRTDKGSRRFDRIKFNIPAYRYITSRVATSRFARSLAILLKSGVQLLNALQDVSALMDNRYLEEKLVAAVERIKNREEPVVVLREIGVFPSLFLKMFLVGEKTGNLDEMLSKSAYVFDEEVDEAVERFTAMLEPVLIIILSLIVGAILLSVVLPMISIMNAI